MLHNKDVELVKEDGLLLGLAVMLDNDQMLDALQTVPQFREVCSLETDYLRYKPATSCAASLILTFTDGRQHYLFAKALTGERFLQSWQHPRRQALRAKNDPFAPVALHSLRIILSYPQQDRGLPHLWLLNASPQRDALFRCWLPELSPTAPIDLKVLRYKPERRLLALLSCEGQPVAVLRFASAGRFDAMLAGNQLGEEAGEIKLLAVVADYRLLITQWIDGETLCPEQGGNLPPDALLMMGRKLAQMHNYHLSPAIGNASRESIEDGWRVLSSLCIISPQQGAVFSSLLSTLCAKMANYSCQPALIHGDFTADQVIRRQADGELQLIDWDRAKIGNPAGDLASFQARLELQVIERTLSSQQASCAVAAFQAGYWQQCRTFPLHLNDYVALALLQLATEPFRKRSRDWPQQTAALVQRAQELMTATGLQNLLDKNLMAEPLRLALGLSPSASLEQVNTLACKPGRRAVLEYQWRLPPDGVSWTVVGKYRCKGFNPYGYNVQQALWLGAVSAEVTVPEPLVTVPALHLWLQRKVVGQRMTDLLSPVNPDLQSLGFLAGQALAKLQFDAAAQLVVAGRLWTIDDELDVLRQRLATAMKLLPTWAARIEKVASDCELLARSLPAAETVFSHRDFYPAQLMIPDDNPAQIVILDFDLATSGPAALDVGNYLAHLHEQALRNYGDINALNAHRQAFLAGWRSEKAQDEYQATDVFTTLALARHIAISRLFPEREWTTERLLALCEERLCKALEKR